MSNSPIEPNADEGTHDVAHVAAPALGLPVEWRRNLGLFLATLVSVFVTGALGEPGAAFTRTSVIHGAQFAGALLSILLAHEFGHYFAARIHRVPSSLPFFIPMPFLSPFGTMGAVIQMRGTISTRKALLDIGAAGPLAGLVLAIPLYAWGVAHSTMVPLAGSEGVQLGESLALKLLDYLAGPSVPAGMELDLSPVAFAAWAGFFVTMINLIPVGQLDGGHVAFSLFGPKQNRYATIVHRAMLVFFFVSLAQYLVRDVQMGFGFARLGQHIGNSLFWLVWFEMLAILGSVANRKKNDDASTETLSARTRLFAVLGLAIVAGLGREKGSPIVWLAWFGGLGLLLAMEYRGGALRPSTLLDHPPTDDVPLGLGRKIVAVVTLLLFLLLFMPAPMMM